MNQTIIRLPPEVDYDSLYIICEKNGDAKLVKFEINNRNKNAIQDLNLFHKANGAICKCYFLKGPSWIILGGNFGIEIYLLRKVVDSESNTKEFNITRLADKVQSSPVFDFVYDENNDCLITSLKYQNKLCFHSFKSKFGKEEKFTEFYEISDIDTANIGVYKLLLVPRKDESSILITASKDNRIKFWNMNPFRPRFVDDFYREILIKNKPISSSLLDFYYIEKKDLILLIFENARFRLYDLDGKFKNYDYNLDKTPFLEELENYIFSPNYDKTGRCIKNPVLLNGEVYDKKTCEEWREKYKINFFGLDELKNGDDKKKLYQYTRNFTKDKILQIYRSSERFLFYVALVGYFETYTQKIVGNFYGVVKVLDMETFTFHTVQLLRDCKFDSYLLFDEKSDCLVTNYFPMKVISKSRYFDNDVYEYIPQFRKTSMVCNVIGRLENIEKYEKFTNLKLFIQKKNIKMDEDIDKKLKELFRDFPEHKLEDISSNNMPPFFIDNIFKILNIDK